MPIVIRLGTVMSDRRIRHITDLAEKTGVSRSTLTTLWYNRAKGISFDVLEKLCQALHCQPGDLLAYTPSDEEST